jgi:hypothetical protein
MNALKHGLRAQTIILPNERQEDFDQIHNSLRQQYHPQNPAEQLLVNAAVIAQWKMVRAEVYETAAYDKKQIAPPQSRVFSRHDPRPKQSGAPLLQGLR